MGKKTRRDPTRRAAPADKNWNSGFTLVETLLVVAILVVLLALSMVGVVHYRDSLKITELDNAARDISMAAQNRAVLLQNSGRLVTLLNEGGQAVPLSSRHGGTRCISSRAADGLDEEDPVFKALNELVPVGSIDPALRDKGEFYVVYDPDSASVTDVFYIETQGQVTINEALTLVKDSDNRNGRMTNKKDSEPAMVGYYGSDKGEAIGTHPLPTPGVEVIIKNGEELTLTVKYTLPAEGVPAGVTRIPSVKLKYGGAEVTLLEVNNVGDVVPLSDTRRTGGPDEYTWVLDSLHPDKRFKGLSTSFTDLGGSFTVTAGLTLKAEGYIDSAYYAAGEDNSLFDTSTQDGGTAYIVNLRHLQNLDKDNTYESKVRESITKAEQRCDIDASANGGSAYSFIPIKNGSLKSFDGQKNHINKLNVDATGPAGLFAECKGTAAEPMKVTAVRLVDAEVKGTAAAGAIAGTVEHCELTGCQVYWNEPEKLTTPSKYVYKVNGESAGGLIGEALGAVTITESFAATTIKGTTAAGGLIGTAAGTVTVTRSYADSYLKGESGTLIGGLAGTGSGAVELADSYAAGFIVDPTDKGKTAGLYNGSAAVTTGTGVYSAVRLLRTGDNSLDEPGKLLADELSGSGAARYLYTEADVKSAALGAALRLPNTETHVHNLRYKRTSNPADKLKAPYIFPGLEGVPHHGDWAELTIPAGLAYYEEYTDIKNDSKYGAEGCYEPEDTDEPTIAALRKDTDNPAITKDGYALIFKGDATTRPPVTIRYGEQVWRLEGTKWTKEDWTDETTPVSHSEPPVAVPEIKVTANGTDYTLLPLPDALQTGDLADTEHFYQELEFQIKPTPTDVPKKSERTFYFNPHFAKTVKSGTVTVTETGGVTTTTYTKPARPDDPKTETNPVYVRTPRHFYDLSGFQTATYNYAARAERLFFKQELDLDYSSYTKGYTGSQKGSFKYTGTGNYEQYAIGKEGVWFTGTYDGQYHMIKNVFFKPDSPGGDVGLFGKIDSGSVLQNIVYEQKGVLEADEEIIPEISGKHHVGALVGLNWGGTVTNCAVFGVRMKGNNMVTGGLAGKNDGEIKNCAAEVVSLTTTSTYTGGLLGMNTNKIENSYAVGKIDGTGNEIAGLTAQNSGTVETSYAAVDLVTGGVCQRYGLCNNITEDGRTGSFDAKSGWLEDVYVYRGIKYNLTEDYKDRGSAVTFKALEEKLSEQSTAGEAVVRNIPDGASYESTYKDKDFPYLSGVKTVFERDDDGSIKGERLTEAVPVHYGLWPVTLPVGLAYYEEYDAGAYGAEGYYEPENFDDAPTIKTLRNDTQNPVVTKDGYALVFQGEDKDIPQGEYKVKYGKISEQDWTLTKSENKYTWTLSGTTSQTVECVTPSTGTYTLIPLPDKIVTGELPDETTFYQELKFGLQSFYFNPYFAKTVKMPVKNGETLEAPPEPESIKGTTKEIEKGNPAISIRTPRHFYNLSAHPSTPGEYYYLQELDLDYSSYTGYSGNFEPGKDGAELPFRQAPISLRDKTGKQLPFTYDGDYHQISNVVFEGAEKINRDDDNDKELCTGLFAGVWWEEATTSVLKNVVYKMNPATPYVYKLETEPARTLVIGVLVGSNAGTVRNCAVYDVNMEVNLNGECCWNRDIVFGGLVGRMRGAVVNCSAELANVEANIENGHAGGLVGRLESNTYDSVGGRIFSSYAVGKLTTRYEKGTLSGLVGEHTPYGTIKDCYAAVFLGGNSTEKYGLFWPGDYGDTISPNNSYWVKGRFIYRGGVYSDYNSDEYKNNDQTGYRWIITPAELKDNPPEDMAQVEPKYTVKDFPSVYPEGDDYSSLYTSGFPYLSGVKTVFERYANGRIKGERLTNAVPVHYGLWPVENTAS